MPDIEACTEEVGRGYSSKGIANLILDWADEEGHQDVTPLKIQKLLFFCHADFLIETGRPLVSDEFEAWSYGPVLPAVYQSFKAFGGMKIKARCQEFNPITRLSSEPKAVLTSSDYFILRPIYDLHAKVSGTTLSALSHRPGGPWDRALFAFKNYRNINRRISNRLILEHHLHASA